MFFRLGLSPRPAGSKTISSFPPEGWGKGKPVKKRKSRAAPKKVPGKYTNLS
jgi:hypothetical protein